MVVYWSFGNPTLNTMIDLKWGSTTTDEENTSNAVNINAIYCKPGSATVKKDTIRSAFCLYEYGMLDDMYFYHFYHLSTHKRCPVVSYTKLNSSNITNWIGLRNIPNVLQCSFRPHFGQFLTEIGLALFWQNSAKRICLYARNGGSVNASGDVIAYSDARLKDGIKDLIKRQGDIMPKAYIKDGRPSIGFITQDVQKIYPESAREDDNGYLMLNYQAYTAVLQAAVYELKKQIDELKSQVATLIRPHD